MENHARSTQDSMSATIQRPYKAKILLREPERCWECGRTFISLYPLKHCGDHEDLERLH